MPNDETRIPLDGGLFGCDTLVYSHEIVALEGPTAAALRKGMVVTVRGDSRGYVPGGFESGQVATIVGFLEPGASDPSDHVVVLSDGSMIGRVKPWNVEPRNELVLDLLKQPPIGRR